MFRRIVPLLLGFAVIAAAEAETLDDVKARAEKLARVAATIAGVEPRDQFLVVRTVPEAMPRPKGIDSDQLGWYMADGHELAIRPDIPASIDDALMGLVQTELRRGLGEPAAPWFSRGVAYALLGSARGLDLTQVESRTEAVTPAEVVDGLGRPRTTLAPAEARLARCIIVELGGSLPEAWGRAPVKMGALEDRFIAAWDQSLQASGVSPQLAYPRSVRRGKYVALDASLSGSGTKPFENGLKKELRRVAELGVSGVEIPVEVRLPTESGGPLGREGASVVGGSAPLIRTALFARELGLSVVLAPRFKPALEAAERVDPSALEAYGLRRASAVETLSWVAEFALVDGLVLFDKDELCVSMGEGLEPDLRAARRAMRRRSLVGSRPFAGDRLAFAADEADLIAAQTEDFSSVFRGPLAVINLKVGVRNEIPGLGFQRVGSSDLPDVTESGKR